MLRHSRQTLKSGKGLKNKGKKKPPSLFLTSIQNLFWWVLWLLILTISIYIFLDIASLQPQMVIAAVTQLEPSTGEILYRSQTKLDDQSGNVWQVILFKQVYPSQGLTVNLRLVGFPDSAEVIHPQPLRISTATGKVLTAADVFLDEAPAPTIGQYDFKDIIPQLTTEPLVLGIPLPGERYINISVPSSVVKEWQVVMKGGE